MAKKKRGKKISTQRGTFILIFVATIVCVVIIWQTVLNSLEEEANQASSQMQANDILFNKSEQAQVDVFSGWKTYTNTKYGFEMKYPSDWYLYAGNQSDVFFQPTKEINGGIPGPHANALEVKVEAYSSQKSLDSVIKDKFAQAGISFTKNSYEIGGISGLKVIFQCEGVGCGAPEWFVTKGNNLYYFNSNLGYSKTFDQILSTFKFTK